MDSKIKILITYHKQGYLLKDDILTPIHAGRAVSRDKLTPEVLRWMEDNMPGDDTGESISAKNSSYNELTTVYWAWKNYDRLGDPDWIGFMHYRRHFLFRGGDLPYYEMSPESDEQQYLDALGYAPQRLDALCRQSDFITVMPQRRDSMYAHYRRNHRVEDLDRVVALLKEKYPAYASSADRYLQGQNAYFCNMFVFPKALFMEYAAWLFDILFAYENMTDLTGKRLFVSEWLTGIFIQHLIDGGKRGTFLPTAFCESERVIPVVFAADDRYAIPMSVAVASLLKNARPGTCYDVYLLLPGNFSDENRRRLTGLADAYPGSHITAISMNDRFSNSAITTSHLSHVSYYRLMIPSLLPQYSKCIYLDVDLVVNGDLSELYRISVDDYLVAGVPAAGYRHPKEWASQHAQELGIPSTDQYINAGVLLMNLAGIRRSGVDSRFLELSEETFSSEDQDIINLACYDNIKQLPLRYNLMTKYLHNAGRGPVANDILLVVSDRQEIDDALRRPLILHYADKTKPWDNPESVFAGMWWDYYSLSPFYVDFGVNVRLMQAKIISLRHQVTKCEAELNSIRSSASYRFARLLTWLPRKLRGGVRCLRENGMKYTVRRALHHLHIIK